MLQVNFNDGENTGTVVVDEGGVGHSRCGVSFNPGQDIRVTRIKAFSAALMQEFANLQAGADDPDAKRCYATAMTQLESAQMFGVKGLFAKANKEGRD